VPLAPPNSASFAIIEAQLLLPVAAAPVAGGAGTAAKSACVMSSAADFMRGSDSRADLKHVTHSIKTYGGARQGMCFGRQPATTVCAGGRPAPTVTSSTNWPSVARTRQLQDSQWACKCPAVCRGLCHSKLHS
jgi:hypothetical protein